MSCTRHIIICEGESEWAYLQRLQSFLEEQPLEFGAFEPALKFFSPKRIIARSGTFGNLKKRYTLTRNDDRKTPIQIWADFDLYHRNDKHCADHYASKAAGIPDFLFSYHNFEDFFALHAEEDKFQEWVKFGEGGHFTTPLHSREYLPEIKRIFPEYG